MVEYPEWVDRNLEHRSVATRVPAVIGVVFELFSERSYHLFNYQEQCE